MGGGLCLLGCVVGHLEGVIVGCVVCFCVDLSVWPTRPVFLVGTLDGVAVECSESEEDLVSVPGKNESVRFPFSGSFVIKESVSASIQLVFPSVVITYDIIMF